MSVRKLDTYFGPRSKITTVSEVKKQRITEDNSNIKDYTLFLDLQKKHSPNHKTMDLKKICETRWICQIAACLTFRKTFSIILLLLNKIILHTKCEKSMEAKSILGHINFEFIFCLHLFCDIFHEIKIVSDYLQQPDSDLGDSCIMVESLIDYLKEYLVHLM